MAEKNQQSAVFDQQQQSIKIGYYILGETLGIGTFGKVKSKLIDNLNKHKINFRNFFSFKSLHIKLHITRLL